MKKILSLFIILVGLFGIYNISAEKSIAITTNEDITNKTLQIGGQPFGIKFYSEGAMVTKVRENSPADNGGLKINDIIIGINDEKIKSNDKVKELVKNSNGKELTFTVNRDYEIVTLKIRPEIRNGKFTAGMWIKDSCAGIGTITYYDEEKHTFACLGHGICDKESSFLLPMAEGEICPATIDSIEKGKDGYPGGLNGYFSEKEIGQAYYNSQYGLFCNNKTNTNYKEYKVAQKNEIKKGNAYIYTTIDGDSPEFYKVNIRLSNSFTFDKMKEIVIEITDERLINKTGGIVQGMSGSPIIQNNKLIGAVTHVFVNNPKKGYGILVKTMLEEENNK